MSNAPNTETEEQYSDSPASRDEALVYLSRYLFWLVMAVLLAAFSLVI